MANRYDGYNTTFTMAVDSSLKFTPKTLKPPGVSSGGPIDVTPLSATAWRTAVMKSLKTLTPMVVKAFWDTDLYADAIAYVGNAGKTLFTITFSNTKTLAFYAAFDNVEFDEESEGDAPMVTLTIQPTNLHSSTGAETAPVYT